MKAATKVWLIVAAALILTGAIIFAGVITMLNWDFSGLSTDKYQTNEYALSDAFRNIAIVTDTAEIDFVAADTCKIVCYDQENAAHAVSIDGGTLTIKLENHKKWYEHIGINFASPKITVYLPRGDYGDLHITASTGATEIPGDFTFQNIDIEKSTGRVTLFASAQESIKVKTSTGSIRLENSSAGQLDLTVKTGGVTVSGVACTGDVRVKTTTGKATLTDLSCKKLISNGGTGDIDMKNVVASESFTITRSTGDVKFDNCDAAELTVTTSTGSVKGTLLSDKIFFTDTDTGSVRVPKTTTGGRCDITTSTGNIKIDVE